MRESKTKYLCLTILCVLKTSLGIEKGSFSFIVDEKEKSAEKYIENNIFESSRSYTLEEKYALVMQEYEKKIEEINNSMIRTKRIQVSKFSVKVSQNCYLDLAKLKPREELQECEWGEENARSFIFSQVHFLLKDYLAKGLGHIGESVLLKEAFFECVFE